MFAKLLILLLCILYIKAQPNTAQQQVVLFATSSTQLSITDFFLPFNVQNPVKVTLLSPVDSFNMIEFCFSPSFIPFPDQLINTCHSGGYGSFYSTNTSEIHSLNQSTRKSIKFQEKLSQSFQTNSQSSPFSVFINLQPYQNYFVGAIGSNSSITLQLDYTYCERVNEFGSNCSVPAPNLLVNQYILFTAGTGASYFSYTVPNDTIGSISVRVESNTTGDIQLQSQSRTIPTIDYAAETYNSTQSKIIQTVIVNPFVADGLSWYFGVFNKGVPCFVNISLSIQVCNASYFGYNCSLDRQSNITMLNVTGEGLTFDKLDNNNNGDNLIYFQLNSTQIPSGAQFVRVSAASLSDDCLPPPLFARLTYLPSRSLFDYNGTMSQVSQVLLNVKDHRPEDWLVAVEANCQFVIWAGENCFDECNNRGSCMCDGMTCDSSTLFIYPTNLTDSFGVCQCDQSDTYQPFDCGEKPKSYKWIYYALGLIFFILMILLAVIVPVVCFMQRRRQMRSDFEKL